VLILAITFVFFVICYGIYSKKAFCGVFLFLLCYAYLAVLSACLLETFDRVNTTVCSTTVNGPACVECDHRHPQNRIGSREVLISFTPTGFVDDCDGIL